MKKIAIWGWWQGNNLGDNWIKNTMYQIFPNADFLDTTTMSFQEYDFVICGGGGLFIRNIIPPWNNVPKELSYGVLGVGAEFKHKNDSAVKLKNNALFFYARDQYSLDCMNIHDIDQSYDLTFFNLLQEVPISQLDTDKLCFIWRDGKMLTEYFGDFKNYINYEDNYDSYVNIINKNFHEIIENDFQTQKCDIESVISNCGFIISGRYHGIVYAIQKGIPCIAIDICPKIRALMKECNLQEYCIKVNEVNVLDKLIKKAKFECMDIRKKQQIYRNKAHNQLIIDVNEIITKIGKT